MALSELSANEAAKRIRSGEISSVELVTACLKRIDATEPNIAAWAFLDHELALSQAAAMDDLRRHGRATGALHGVPVGIKDLFDTAMMPTGWGAKSFADRRPKANSAMVDKLQEAGAIVLGKTTTTELAFLSEVGTRNPHNSEFGSGGSSAGSAAGVAALHVPLAIGSQTNGSVIRPASYCGVYGFKPTRGLISRHGCLEVSATLDQVGVFARSLADCALLADCLVGYDRADPACHTRPKPAMLAGWQAEVPVEPIFATFELPYGDQVSEATRLGLAEVVEALGARVEQLPGAELFAELIAAHRVIHFYEFRRSVENNREIAIADLSPETAPGLAFAGSISDDDYQRALDLLPRAEAFFAAFFQDYDAVLAPAALGVAPRFGEGIGDPICSTIWTFAGLPCLTLPWLNGDNDLPVGIQLIGSFERDDRLLRTAAWLEGHLEHSPD